MLSWDLATRENWQLILSERRLAQRIANPQPNRYDYQYNAISPIYTTCNSHILLVGTHSDSAQPYWFLGARASQYLYVSPSTTSNLISGVQTSKIERVGLNRLTLIQFPNYNIVPYVLQLEIPYWLEDIYVEVWEYEAELVDENHQLLLDIQSDLARLEEKIDTNYGQ